MIEIKIERIKVDTIIGVYDFEKESKQTVYVSLAVVLSSDISAISDALADTCDYDTITKEVLHIGESKQFELIEAFAGYVKQRVETFSNIGSVTVTVEKPAAIPQAETTKVIVS